MQFLKLGFGAAILLATCACGGTAHGSDATIGTPIVFYPNNIDKSSKTVIMSSAESFLSGVDGRVLTVAVANGNTVVANDLTLDINGNMGVRGTVASRSSRSEKVGIAPFRGDALSLIQKLDMVTYHYRNEAPLTPRHIGFIAEDAPAEFSAGNHASVNLNESIGIELAATRQLSSEVKTLRAEVAALREELRLERRSK